nr:hypothetical protein CFP56_47446 [Quercus suber]
MGLMAPLRRAFRSAAAAHLLLQRSPDDDHTFKKKMQLINSTDLNSFQVAGKAITQNHPLLPYIDVRCKGYTLSPSEHARREEGRYRSKYPPPFILEDLGVTGAVPTPVDHPRRRQKKKTGNATSRSPLPIREELIIPSVIPQEGTPAKMSF